MENHDNFSTFTKGFIFGGIIGAGFALLYAPKTGKELREEIKKKSSEFKDDMDEKITDVQTLTSQLLEESMKKAEELKKQAEQIIKDAQKQAKDIMREYETKFSEKQKNEDVEENDENLDKKHEKAKQSPNENSTENQKSI